MGKGWCNRKLILIVCYSIFFNSRRFQFLSINIYLECFVSTLPAVSHMSLLIIRKSVTFVITHFVPISLHTLTHFMPLVSFHTPWKHKQVLENIYGFATIVNSSELLVNYIYGVSCHAKKLTECYFQNNLLFIFLHATSCYVFIRKNR